MAVRATSLKPIFCADSRGCGGDHHCVRQALREVDRPLQRLHAAQAAADHGRPALDAQLASASRAWLRTQSFTTTSGKSLPKGLPVAGLRLAGPVEPWQPPRLLLHTTKKRRVSIGLARSRRSCPTSPACAHPLLWKPAAWWWLDRAWQSRMALLRARVFSSP